MTSTIILLILSLVLLVSGCEMINPPSASTSPIKVYCGAPYIIKWRYTSGAPLKAFGGTLQTLNSTLDRYISFSSPPVNVSIPVTISCFTSGISEYFAITDINDTILCNSAKYELTRCGNGIVDVRSSLDSSLEECDPGYNKSYKGGCSNECYCLFDWIGIEGVCYKTNYYSFNSSIVINKRIDLKGSSISVNGNITLNYGAIINSTSSIKAECINGTIIYDASNTSINTIFDNIYYKCSYSPTVNVINTGCLKYQSNPSSVSNGINLVFKFSSADNLTLAEKFKKCSGSSKIDYVNCGCGSLYITVSSIVISIVLFIVIMIIILMSIGCSKIKKKIFPWRRDRNYDEEE